MTHSLLRESGPGKMRADAIAIFALGIASAASVVALTVRAFAQTFTADGISWRLPIEPQVGMADGLTLYNSSGPVDAGPIAGSFTHLQVVVPNLNTVSTVCIGVAIVLAALALLAVIASTVRVAWLFQQGRFFTLATSRALRTLNWSLLGGGLGAYVCWKLGANGVEAALNVRVAETNAIEFWGWYVIALFTVTSLGLIDIALRRAIRLQHDAEGLV